MQHIPFLLDLYKILSLWDIKAPGKSCDKETYLAYHLPS